MATSLSPADRAALKQKAEQAKSISKARSIIVRENGTLDDTDHRATFISACSPDVVLALLRSVEVLEKTQKALEALKETKFVTPNGTSYWAHGLSLVADELEQLSEEDFDGRRAKLFVMIRYAAREMQKLEAAASSQERAE